LKAILSNCLVNVSVVGELGGEGLHALSYVAGGTGGGIVVRARDVGGGDGDGALSEKDTIFRSDHPM